MRLNPEFGEAFGRCEEWAIERAKEILALDGVSSRRFPERDREEDGTKKNFCGSCPYKSGCIICDLPYDPRMKGFVGILDD